MTNHVLLNNVDHKDLRVIADRGEAFGDAVMSCLTFPNEFRDIQAHYPVLFQKNPQTGAFQAVALFGFEAGENLFLEDHGWNAHYVPMALAMQPFLIGTQQQPGEAPQMVIHVDMDSPRISTNTGQPVFLPHGGNTPYLESVAAMLDRVHMGATASAAFYAAITELDLLEPLSLEIEFDGGARKLTGFHTINEDRLYTLDSDTLGRLNEQGYLQPIYMAVASLSCFRDLIERKNRKR